MFTLIFGFLTTLITPLFNWLTVKTDSATKITLNAQTTAGDLIAKAEEANASVRVKEGAWSPWVMATIVGFMAPFGWHTWEVVLDSSRWVPVLGWMWGWLPYPSVAEHVVGTWHVASLPGMFEQTEHAVINSLFIGASALLAGSGLIKMWKR
jgi:hypothetical protein